MYLYLRVCGVYVWRVWVWAWVRRLTDLLLLLLLRRAERHIAAGKRGDELSPLPRLVSAPPKMGVAAKNRRETAINGGLASTLGRTPARCPTRWRCWTRGSSPQSRTAR